MTKTNFTGTIFPPAGQPLSMKILILSKKFPYPLRDGESQAIHGLSKSLSELGAEVSLLAMNTSRHFFSDRQLPTAMEHYREVRTVNVDTELRYGDALRNLVRGTSYHLSRFDAPDFHLELAKWLNEESFDLIQLETLYLTPYVPTIRKHSKAAIAMRAHNVEFEIWERISENMRFLPKRWYLRHLTRQLRRYESAHLNDYDILLPITGRDEQHFQRLGFSGKSYVVPIGLDTDCGEPDYSVYRQAASLSFIGSLDWMPNLEGLNWFLTRVWPLVHRQHPTLKFHVAGRNMPPGIRNLQLPGVAIHGEVDCACDFVNAHPISIVPLLSGSGMRAKILEAMSLGRTVLTTSVGLEGIEAQHGVDVMVADSPEAFAQILDKTVSMIGSFEKLGRAAERTFENRYDRVTIARGLLQTYHSLTKAPITV